SSRRRHTRFSRDWSSDVCSSDLLIDSDTLTWDLEFGPVDQSVLTGDVVQASGITIGQLMTAAVLRIGKHLSLLVDLEYDQPDFSLVVPARPVAATSVDLLVVDGFAGPNNSWAWRTGLTRTAG